MGFFFTDVKVTELHLSITGPGAEGLSRLV